jgi:hypothetical protein
MELRELLIKRGALGEMETFNEAKLNKVLMDYILQNRTAGITAEMPGAVILIGFVKNHNLKPVRVVDFFGTVVKKKPKSGAGWHRGQKKQKYHAAWHRGRNVPKRFLNVWL